MYNKKTLTFTFHHYWGPFCQGAFVLDPLNTYIYMYIKEISNYMYQHTDFIWLFNIYIYISVICAAFLWSVPIDKARVNVLDHIRNLLGQFIIWHALTNAERYVLWCNRARSMSVVANENNDVTLFREVNCKMRLFAMKYSIEFEEKIN
jgi:hypothetical protein